MKDLEEATANICDLKGSLLAVHCVLNAITKAMPPSMAATVAALLEQEREVCSTVLLNTVISEHTRTAFERDAQLLSTGLNR